MQRKILRTIIDAYKPKKGDFPRNFSPDVALFSAGMENAASVGQDTFIINSLGEMEIKNLMVYATTADEDNSVIYKLNGEGLNIVHLGRLKKKLETADLEKIMNPDVLFIPVGGGQNYIDAETAAELSTVLEPRIIIPLGYHCDTDPEATPVTVFVKEIGLKPETGEKKVIIKKKDLPQEETRLIILEKE